MSAAPTLGPPSSWCSPGHKVACRWESLSEWKNGGPPAPDTSATFGVSFSWCCWVAGHPVCLASQASVPRLPRKWPWEQLPAVDTPLGMKAMAASFLSAWGALGLKHRSGHPADFPCALRKHCGGCGFGDAFLTNVAHRWCCWCGVVAPPVLPQTRVSGLVCSA